MSVNEADALNVSDADASNNSVNANQSADAPKPVEYSEFKKVIEQRQAEKKARKELEEKLHAIEKKAAEEQGKYKELYEKRESQYNELYGSWLKDKVQSSVQKALIKAGCIDDELALTAGRSELLEFDESTGKVDGVESWLQDLKERKPVLFQSVKTPTINPATPGGGLRETATVPVEDVSKLSKEQILNKLRLMSKK
jgi:hypothetical protein